MTRLPLLFGAALAAAPALAQTPAELPLRPGYYVAAETPCAVASNATLQLVTGQEFSWPQQVCRIAEVTARASDEFTVAIDCEATADFPAERLTITLTIPDDSTFGLSFSGEPPALKRFCAQQDLPEPWRSNDLSALAN